MARPLLSKVSRRMAWLGLFLCQSACLMPQDDTYFTGQADRRNRPPRIVERQIKPDARVLETNNGQNCELQFEVLVEDPDVDDVISVSWFVDFGRGGPSGAFSEQKLTNNTKAQRDHRGSLTMAISQVNNPLNPPGLHLVEALVADARLIDREPVNREVRGEEGVLLIDPGYAVSYAWFVETVAGDCTP